MAQVTLNPSADTYIRSDTADTNYEATTFYIGERNDAVNAKTRLLIKFDTSSIPTGSTINSATLSLYKVLDLSSNARTLYVNYLKRNWLESQATWNSYSTGNAWQTAGADGANDVDGTSNGSVSMSATETLDAFKDITIAATGLTAIGGWVNGTLSNYGWLLQVDTQVDDAYRYNARDNTNPPKLLIDYTAPPSSSFFAIF